MYESKPLAGLGMILVFVAGLGALAALAFAQTDLTNFITRSADARAQDEETHLWVEKTGFDLENYKSLETLRVKQEQERLAIEAETQKKLAQQALAQQQERDRFELEQARRRADLGIQLEQITRYLILLSAGVSAAILSVALAFRITRPVSGRRPLPETTRLAAPGSNGKQPAAGETDRWRRDPAWVERQVRRARQAELANRLAQQAEAGPVTYSVRLPSRVEVDRSDEEDISIFFDHAGV